MAERLLKHGKKQMIAPITDSLFHENIQFILKDTAATSRRQLSYNTTIKGQNDDEPVSFILTDRKRNKIL
jgi:hypothetical protein